MTAPGQLPPQQQQPPPPQQQPPPLPESPAVAAPLPAAAAAPNDREQRPTVTFTLGDVAAEDRYDGRRITLGVCAMAKKVHSKPMKEIITRLQRFGFLEIVIFDERVIVSEPPDRWPVVDCLVSFHSNGFPLDKAVEYESLRRPMLINDLAMQYKLMDRRAVHRILDEQGIEQPKFAVVERERNVSDGQNPTEVAEYDDHIEVNGVSFHKPFVEKPISAEDHNIYIYYPSSAGGGSQRLFRKIGSRSSVYSPISRIRTTGSYIYEEFMPTDGTDIKVYTVGMDYAHAEGRKSPALDGKVERDKNGKEVRYPIILTAKEKLIARKICYAFKQTVCGFDLLRANGTSYVCDVNGFSFVKTSPKYYDDCATVLGTMILRQLAPTLSLPIPASIADPEVPPIMPTTIGAMMELRCVIGIIRHGDRTPKQKMKMEIKQTGDTFSGRFFSLFEKYGGYRKGQLKMKQPRQLQEVLDIARSLLDELGSALVAPPVEFDEKRIKLLQMKSVLEMYGYFSGINRKIQLKYQPHGFHSSSSTEEDLLVGEPSLVLILKWGGELTAAGKMQAEELGKAFRCMYPTYGDAPGLGLLRLHSTFRHDLKIYASDEGRVQMTAAAFAKGLLALEGELTPILAQMVKSGSHVNGLLDNAYEARPLQRQAKGLLTDIVNADRELADEDRGKLNPCQSTALQNAMDFVKNPYKCCQEMHGDMRALLQRIRALKADPKQQDATLYHGESWELMLRRWSKLEKDFSRRDGFFDVSKIPDIYDCVKYDLHHNQRLLEFERAKALYTKAKAMADVVVPLEYGVTKDEKLHIGAIVATPLLRKIRADLLTNAHEGEGACTRLDSRLSMGVSSPDRHVRTRLYFTSESHMQSLMNLVKYGGLSDDSDPQWTRALEYITAVSELNYMTQLVIMMYEDASKDPDSDERFHVEMHFSPGAYGVEEGEYEDAYPVGFGFRPKESLTHESPAVSRISSTKDLQQPTHISNGIVMKSGGDDFFSESPDLIHDIQHVSTDDDEMVLVHEEAMDTAARPRSCSDSIRLPPLSPEVDTGSIPEHDALVESVGTSRGEGEDDIEETVETVSPLRLRKVSQPIDMASPPAVKQDRSSVATLQEKARSYEDTLSPMRRYWQHPPTMMPQSVSPSMKVPHVAASARILQLRQIGDQAYRVQRLQQQLQHFVLHCAHAPPQSPNLPPTPHSAGVYHSPTALGSRSPVPRRQQQRQPTDQRQQQPQNACPCCRRRTRWRLSDATMASWSRASLAASQGSTLISTKVISGSYSAPNLQDIDLNLSLEAYGMAVPEIRPLETLHNALTLKKLEAFLATVADSTVPSPSRSFPTTPANSCMYIDKISIVAAAAAAALPSLPPMLSPRTQDSRTGPLSPNSEQSSTPADSSIAALSRVSST